MQGSGFNIPPVFSGNIHFAMQTAQAEASAGRRYNQTWIEKLNFESSFIPGILAEFLTKFTTLCVTEGVCMILIWIPLYSTSMRR
jgi:hypothetical protein